MNHKKIWLSSPHMGGKEYNYVQEIFDLNGNSSLNASITSFEQEVASYIGADTFVTALSSGTAGIHLALILAGVKENDSVICQSFTFAASANPILYLKANPVFVDSEATTWNLCPIQLEKAIVSEIKKGTKPKAIVAMHTYGMPYQVNEIHAIAKKYDILIIEDAASALGSSYQNKKCGTLGDFGIISFNANKIITTFGGGALVTKTKEEQHKAVFLASQAKDTAVYYQHSTIGYNYTMSPICAATGIGQLEVLEQHLERRRAMHHFYKEVFKNNPAVVLFEEPSKDYYSNYWLSVILLQNKAQREGLRIHLEKLQIESRPVWKPMHLQPVFEKYAYYGTTVSEDLFERGLCLPSGSNLTAEDRVRLKSAIQSFFKFP